MSLTEKQKKRIEKMSREGKTFSFICHKLFGNYDRYKEVQDHCWASGCLSWQGTKKMISNRLKLLGIKTISEKGRKDIIQEIREYVDYLYICGNDLEKKVNNARRALR